jgi:hypothetical protein
VRRDDGSLAREFISLEARLEDAMGMKHKVGGHHHHDLDHGHDLLIMVMIMIMMMIMTTTCQQQQHPFSTDAAPANTCVFITGPHTARTAEQPPVCNAG